MTGALLTQGIDFLFAENDREGSPLYQKLDTSKLGVGGHSLGSLSTYDIAEDERITTTVHVDGGQFDGYGRATPAQAGHLYLWRRFMGHAQLQQRLRQRSSSAPVATAAATAHLLTYSGSSAGTDGAARVAVVMLFSTEAHVAWPS